MTQDERKVMELALEAYLCREMPAGTIIGDPKWWVPKIASAIKEALAQPKQDTNKNGSPCPEFWDWLPKAYNFEGDGNFTKYNMEVAFLAGKQALQPEQEPVAWVGEISEEAELMLEKPKFQAVPLYTTPPQRTERPVDCERCNRLEEQAYDLVGKLRVANIKLSMQPQRTWQGLTDDEKEALSYKAEGNTWTAVELAEAKLKEKNT